MRHPISSPLLLLMAGAFALSACGRISEEEKNKEALATVNAVDASNMSEIMLTVADPQEAVNYFKRSVAEHPERIDLQRGLAKSLVRADQAREGEAVWRKVISMQGATNEDRVSLADAQIRASDWKDAAATLNSVPPTYESFERYKAEAMVADSQRQWKKADSFYQTAAGMTTRPGGVLNNWGFSKLTRGDAAGAEKLFTEALTYEPSSFTIKNNLVLSRAAQRKYDMPIVDMSQAERAQLLYTAALSAIKQGDVAIGKGLLQDAIDTSPTYFEEASRALDALNSGHTGG